MLSPRHNLRPPTAARLLLPLWTLLCFLWTGSGWSQTLETERWRVPMRVDRSDVSTDMLLEFSFERLEADLGEYEASDDADKQIMLQFTEALVSGDVDTALDLTAIVPGTARDDSRELLNAFSGMLENAPDLLQLERVVHLGPDRLLVWSLPISPEERYYRSFRFVREEGAELRYEGVATEPISSLLTYTFQVSQNSGPDPRPPQEFEYEYTIPATEEQPVKFRFDGEELEVDAFNPLGETGYPPVDFFNESMALLADGEAAAYAARFTDFSENRYVAWAADQGPEAYEAYRNDMMLHGARVVFLLEADPLYLVFYLPTDTAVKGSPLRYAAVYDNPQTGLELTNFYVHGLADTVLQRREYFEEPFLRPLLAASGIIPAQPEAEGVVASAGETLPPDPDEILADLDAIALADLEAAASPPPGDIEDLARESLPWPWILGACVLLGLAAFALAKRK